MRITPQGMPPKRGGGPRQVPRSPPLKHTTVYNIQVPSVSAHETTDAHCHSCRRCTGFPEGACGRLVYIASTNCYARTMITTKHHKFYLTGYLGFPAFRVFILRTLAFYNKDYSRRAWTYNDENQMHPFVFEFQLS